MSNKTDVSIKDHFLCRADLRQKV